MLKDGESLKGLECDWLAVDESGQVAVFSTAGGGYTPMAFLVDTDSHIDALEKMEVRPSSTTARFFPEVPEALVNVWRLAAERGLYAYDSTYSGKPYTLVAAPLVPITWTEFETQCGEVPNVVECRFAFDKHETVTKEMLGG